MHISPWVHFNAAPAPVDSIFNERNFSLRARKTSVAQLDGLSRECHREGPQKMQPAVSNILPAPVGALSNF